MNRRAFLQALGLAAAAPVVAKIAAAEAHPARKVRVPRSRHQPAPTWDRVTPSGSWPSPEGSLYIMPKIWDREFIRKFYQDSYLESEMLRLDREIRGGPCGVRIRRR